MVPSNSAQLQKDLCAYARPARPPRSATYTARDAVERLFIPVSAIGLPKRGSKVDEHLPSAGHVKKTQINSQHQEFGPKVSKGGAVTAIFDACALVPFGPCAQTTGRRRAGVAGIGDPLSIGWTPPLATAAGLARLMQANGA